MTIEQMHSYLVHPSKNVDEQPAISGTRIPHEGQLYEMLCDVYERAPLECNIDIVFKPDNDGRQQNDCRDCLLTYARHPGVPLGRDVAERLQCVTTNRSGLGLLFLLKGITGGGVHSLVISRFPADQGVVAQEDAARLSVQFIERIFMKNARAYKSALFTTDSLEAGFFDGRAVDRQISSARDLSEYWISDFLLSELRTTGPTGTRRLAVALRDAVMGSIDLDLKHELVSATRLLRGQQGRTISAQGILQRLGLSSAATRAVERAFPRQELINENFRFEVAEFDKHVLYRTVELNTGAMLMAEDSQWDDVFNAERLVAEGQVRYTAEGEVVDERLKKTR